MIWFIQTSDEGQLQDKLQEIRQQNSLEQVDPLTFDGTSTDFSVGQLIEEVTTMSMFDDKKFIVVKNLPSLFSKSNLSDADFHQLTSVLKKGDLETFIVFVLFDKPLDSRKKMVKFLKEHAVWVEQKQLDSSNICQLIKHYNQKYQLNLNPFCIELIKSFCLDVKQVNDAFEKLRLYESDIDQEVVKKLVVDSRQAILFDFADAIIEKKGRHVFEIYHQLINQKEDPSAVLFILANKYRLIYQILVFEQQEMSESQMVQQLGISPKYLWFLRNKLCPFFKQNQLLKTLSEFARIDQQSKISSVNRQMGFELWLLETLR